MRISDWSSDLCSSDLHQLEIAQLHAPARTADALLRRYPDPARGRRLSRLYRMDRLDLCRAACRAQLLASDGEPHTGALCHIRGIDLVPVGARAARGNRHFGLRGTEYGDRKSTRLNSSH